MIHLNKKKKWKKKKENKSKSGTWKEKNNTNNYLFMNKRTGRFLITISIEGRKLWRMMVYMLFIFKRKRHIPSSQHTPPTIDYWLRPSWIESPSPFCYSFSFFPEALLTNARKVSETSFLIFFICFSFVTRSLFFSPPHLTAVHLDLVIIFAFSPS